VSGLLDHRGNPISSADFRKAAPPKTGPAFGNWAGRDLATLQLPGGGLLQFDLSRLTLADYRSMRDHYQINASLTVLQFMLHRMDWRIECKDQRIADAITENIQQVWTRMVRAMSQSYWAGYSPIALEYENDDHARDGKGMLVVSKFKDLVPEECTVNWKTVEGYAPPGHVRPKYKIYDGIRQQGVGWPIPTENTLWYPLLMENGDYNGKKLLRPAFSSWYFSILMHMFANRYYERFGEPVPIGRAPYDDDVIIDGKTVNGRDAMLSILQSLRSRGVVVLPDDRTQTGDNSSDYSYDIEYLESQMRGADFEKYITRLDEEITLGLFTPLLLLRGASGGGSYNLGVQQMQMYLWMLNALAGDMKEYIDFYVIDRLKNFNFGPNAPRATWEYRQMGKESVETVRAMVTELLRKDKIMPDLTELSAITGISLADATLLSKGDDPEGSDPFADPESITPPSDGPRNGNTSTSDDRTTRTRDDRNRNKRGPKGVGSPRDTQRDIAARIAGQVENAFKKGTFGDKPIVLGYRRALVEGLHDEGMAYDDAASAVERLYSQMNWWLADSTSVGAETYGSAESFVATFNSAFEDACSRVLDGR